MKVKSAYQPPFKSKLIYVFRINDKIHKGGLKVGATSIDAIIEYKPNSKELNDAARSRINTYTIITGLNYELLHTELAIYEKDKVRKSFSDTDVHRVLTNSGFKRMKFDLKNNKSEWFLADLESVKKAIKAVKDDKDFIDGKKNKVAKNPIIFRPEQKEAIDKTKKKFKTGNQMLWFAKMRFGKTLCAIQVVKDMEYSKTLILTHRPVVDDSWYEDFDKIFYEDNNLYKYGSKGIKIGISTLEKTYNDSKGANKYIYFASMQDLRGSESVGGQFDKNDLLFSINWDFIIVDEAHEGTQTELGLKVIKLLKKKKTKVLELSGTPFNLFDNYKEDEIFTWDYVMEQKAKQDWDKYNFGDPNPYSGLPKLNIFTYDLGKLIDKFIEDEYAFNFTEFFAVEDKDKFKHEKDIVAFLNLISKKDEENNYPFSTEEYRDYFRHTLWMLPGVKAAKALSKLLSGHDVFKSFNIINVAGAGDEEKPLNDALKLVKAAIGNKPEESYTITLSCGRLTTGVSVPAWTAVFMLAGSSYTSASSYMQTIFRVQTPATINGKIKEECFVFDFAPDRTLKVFAEATKVSTKAGKTTEEHRKVLDEFLNFCPIISMGGSIMKAYNVNSLLERLKSVFVERVVRNGFEDGYLYNNDMLMKLDELEIKEFFNLKGIIGTTPAIHKSNDIDINLQGFTNEEYEKFEEAEKKNRNKRELTKEEKDLLAKRLELKKRRDDAVSILRGISIRMPLILYGADVSNEDKELTIDNFTKLVDDTSWDEFMPKGVTKKKFDEFKKYYEKDIFRAAGKRIREMARTADDLSIEDRINKISTIFNSFRNPDKETVLTPWRVVNMHLGDCLGGHVFYDEKFKENTSKPRFVNNGKVTEDVFAEDSFILEINSKSGLYPLYIAYNIYKTRLVKISKGFKLKLDKQRETWDKVIKQNIYVICKTPMAKSITIRTLVGFRNVKVNAQYVDNLVEEITNNSDNFIKKIKQGKSFWKSIYSDDMKFNAIVGNPPYMEMDGGASASAKPIYNHFVEISKKMKPKYISMIMPSRWYSGGKGLDEFRDNMLNDENISVLHDFLNPETIFPRTNIRGGICYFLWDKTYDNSKKLVKVVTHKENSDLITIMRSLKVDGAETFIRHGIAISIIQKIKNNNSFESFDKYVSSRKPFGLEGFFVKDENFKETKKGLKNPIVCFGKGKTKGFIEKTEVIHNHHWIDKYKIYTPRANNIGTELNDDNLNTFVGEPGSVCTESYIVLGADLKLNSESSKILSNYFTTKFVRFLHSLMKASQDATSKTYKFVPLQDFTDKSDIDWSKPIPEIDQQLYQKYGLDQSEIAFIESMIKAME